jgi:hypothetical protein
MNIIFSAVAHASTRAASTVVSTSGFCFRKDTSTRLSMWHAWRRTPHNIQVRELSPQRVDHRTHQRDVIALRHHFKHVTLQRAHLHHLLHAPVQ